MTACRMFVWRGACKSRFFPRFVSLPRQVESVESALNSPWWKIKLSIIGNVAKYSTLRTTQITHGSKSHTSPNILHPDKQVGNNIAKQTGFGVSVWQIVYHDDVTKWKNIFRITDLLCRNSPVSGEFPAQRPVTRSFDVFFDLRLNRQLSK